MREEVATTRINAIMSTCIVCAAPKGAAADTSELALRCVCEPVMSQVVPSGEAGGVVC